MDADAVAIGYVWNLHDIDRGGDGRGVFGFGAGEDAQGASEEGKGGNFEIFHVEARFEKCDDLCVVNGVVCICATVIHLNRGALEILPLLVDFFKNFYMNRNGSKIRVQKTSTFSGSTCTLVLNLFQSANRSHTRARTGRRARIHAQKMVKHSSKSWEMLETTIHLPIDCLLTILNLLKS